MTERKFTPPTTYPQEYKTESGTATLCAPMPDGFGFVGVYVADDGMTYSNSWTEDGEDAELGLIDLHDVTERVVCFASLTQNGITNIPSTAQRWVSYGHTIHRIEFDAGTGANPTIEVME